jgi:hypothetical protein
MTARQTAVLIALVAIGLTLAQDVRPGLDVYHTWQYAAALALAMIVLVNYAWGARDGSDGPAGRRIAIAIVGALTVGVGGLLSGLIGPDTITVGGSPGTVTPVPDIGAAAFFAPADPQTIARGDATVSLRRKGADPIAVPAGRQLLLDTSIVFLKERPAAYIVAHDAQGNRLTVTQPTNPSFLSPVLVFPQNQPLRDRTYPLDTFATPAIHRIARALYFSADDAQTFNHLGSRQPALVLSVNDDSGKSVGLSIAPSGREVAVGDLRITATLGTYPQMIVASAPPPAVLVIGLLIFIGGVGAAFVPPKPRPRAAAPAAEPERGPVGAGHGRKEQETSRPASVAE